ncbi:MAG: cytochrome c [Deltaproteobacteria bacterium]|jgi:mono/diheme cytochrome c family protein|nr:cytochrome c [Deltaproteobacteria bacterium]MCL5879724.1 cytochrome c [Deltaproteobacteria bacterium]MDA8304153.1 cytochrome c [Deltaproteobacteria bacterium]
MQKFIASFIIAAALIFSASTVFAASGASLFSSEGCIACHTINGEGGSVGPDLSHVGSKRSLSWIKTQITNPSAHFADGSSVTVNGKSYMAIMPGHKHMEASDLNALAKYLESLK